MDEALLGEVRDHDARVARSGLRIWIGAEPTFTQPKSQHPCWLTEAVSGEKEAHARAMLLALAPRLGGDVRLLRVPGRVYPGEDAPRFCFGALFERYPGLRGPAACLAELDVAEPTPAPTVDESQAWLTITPDPAVVEVNMAPAHDLATFASWVEEIYAAAVEVGLSPSRFRYNGDVTDSGGGGQITFGGPSPAQSPFFVKPQLLPGLIRYLNRHPALSYLFAPGCCGSASQGPRPDESVRERFDELPIALDFLTARGDAATPAELWGMLAPLLVDASGSTHRCEVNVEKLWNPCFAGRGELGLVELRALRMPNTPARIVAIAALFRSLVARLAAEPYLEPIIDWGSRLHDVFGLPWYLERDLEAVLADLDAHGFGLGPKLTTELRRSPQAVAELELQGAKLKLHQAVNFWPLLGDLAAQEQHGARLVDASAARVQLLVRAPAGSALGTITANGWRVPLQRVPQAAAECGIGSVQYRTFLPHLGLHPAVAASDPLVITWEREGEGLRAEIYAWKPGGGAYQGLPADALDARARREARVIVTNAAPGECRVSRANANGLTLDLRRQYGASRA